MGLEFIRDKEGTSPWVENQMITRRHVAGKAGMVLAPLVPIRHRGHLLPAIPCSPHSKPCLQDLWYLPQTLQQGCGEPPAHGTHVSLPSRFPSLQAWHLVLLGCLFISNMARIISVSPECYLDLFINAGNILRILKITAIDHQEIL